MRRYWYYQMTTIRGDKLEWFLESIGTHGSRFVSIKNNAVQYKYDCSPVQALYWGSEMAHNYFTPTTEEEFYKAYDAIPILLPQTSTYIDYDKRRS